MPKLLLGIKKSCLFLFDVPCEGQRLSLLILIQLTSLKPESLQILLDLHFLNPDLKSQ